jgi:sugar-specific transcriptional regulator TrmB
MNIESSLKAIGLEYREKQVYLATLELGSSTVTPISKKSGFKRTYCYDILEDLKKRGLVNYAEKNGRRHYFAEDPKKIEDELTKNLTDFQMFLPELRSIYNNTAEKPKIRYYEGKEGIISVYEENSKAPELLAIGSPNHIYKYLPEYFDEHAKRIIKRKTKIRELITPDAINSSYLKEFRSIKQEARVLPEGIVFSTDLMIFENKLALVSYGINMHAVVIESSSIVDTMKVLFKLIWNQAKPLPHNV